jgi:hypothetical protein
MLCALLTVASGVAAARGPWRADESNTSGWQFMSPQERLRHQAGIRQSGTYEECMRYESERLKAIRERARRRGQVIAEGRQDGCAQRHPEAVRN